MNNNSTENNYICSIEHFIQNEYSICREERQYAVFLYNILRKYHCKDNEKRREDNIVKDIFNACSIPADAEIENVFYEATFMRDFFERNRRLALSFALNKNPKDTLLNKKFSQSNCNIEEDRSFNAKLIEYVATGDVAKHKDVEERPVYKEINLGRNAIPNDYDRLLNEKNKEEIKDIKRKIECMMNAKPDIAVIYIENGQKKLLFLECKFESQEASYRGDYKRKDVYRQRDIQWKIADFLCNHYLLEENMYISDKMEKNKSCLVEFVRKGPEKTKEPNKIWIKDLIELNNEIFS